MLGVLRLLHSLSPARKVPKKTRGFLEKPQRIYDNAANEMIEPHFKGPNNSVGNKLIL